MRAHWLLAFALLLAPSALASHEPLKAHREPEGWSGRIAVGTGAALAYGVDHFIFHAPDGATGFDLEGNVRYLFGEVCGASCGWRVHVAAPVGTVDTAFELRWVHHGSAEIDFSRSPRTDCTPDACPLGALP